jgi:hypothetical protein
MSGRTTQDSEAPVEIDFSKGVRGLHHIPAGAKVFLPVSIEPKRVGIPLRQGRTTGR